jgi:ABC-type branched-subunit amino acid transport system substrate-binding protein
MTLVFPALWRRRALLAAAGSALVAHAWAQPGHSTSAGRPITVAQIFDSSGGQQDVSKDFLIGSRAAWQDINAKGGIRGRPVVHSSIDVDGTPASLRAAVTAVRDNPACVLLSGTSGDPVATGVARLLHEDNVAIAHAAPWLQNSSIEVDDRTFPIFAARQEQIAHALRSLSVMGVREVGAVYSSEQEVGLYQEDMKRLAAEFKLRLQPFRSEGDLVRLGQRLTAQTPAILLFLGGTPELAQFTQGLEKQARQRYVVALADVNLQTLMQMGAARSTPVIATQAVPMVNSTLPVVRSYRETLVRLFDEPPAPLSLAGFIASRYAFEVLSSIDGALTRQSALAAFQRRGNMDVGGFRVAFDPRRRSGMFVTQSMLTLDGRVIG